MKNLYIVLIILLVAITSCSKLVELDLPKNQLTTEAVFSDSTTAVSTLLYAYNLLGGINNSVGGSFNDISLYTDEYAYTAGTENSQQFYLSNLAPDNVIVQNLWLRLYSIIYSCNTILEETKNSSHLSSTLKTMLEGEAKFLRALSYLNLVVFYENLPLILKADVHANMVAGQVSSNKVYDQILLDLIDAEVALKDEYPTNGTLRANRMAAKALLARVYLYRNDWKNAELKSSEVISSDRYSLVPINEVFLAGNNESILQLFNQNNFLQWMTSVIPTSGTTVPTYTITESLKSAFADYDLRPTAWFGINQVTNNQDQTSIYYYPYKYKNRSNNSQNPEYLVVLRLAETILIRAEARIRLGDNLGALEDLNKVRDRAGVPRLPSVGTIEDFLKNVLLERRRELFGEWGHRFQDLKRNGFLDETMGHEKNTWIAETNNRFPIPLREITYNSSLIQNDGY